MIPVVTMNNEGDLSYQLFNDNLAPVEQVNRKLLYVIAYAQTKLVDDRNSFQNKIGTEAYTDTKVDAINTAADTLVKAVKSAIDTFAATL